MKKPDLQSFGVPIMGTQTKGLFFDEKIHQYYHDGKRLASVTGILKTIGVFNHYAGMPPDKRQASLTVGEMVHAEIAGLLKSGEAKSRHEISNVRHQANQFLNWKDENDLEVWASEICVMSLLWSYAGRLDALGEVATLATHRRRCIIEIKTGGVESWHALQLAGYCKCLSVPFHRVVVGLSPDSSKAVHRVYEPDDRSSADWMYALGWWDACKRYGLNPAEAPKAQNGIDKTMYL